MDIYIKKIYTYIYIYIYVCVCVYSNRPPCSHAYLLNVGLRTVLVMGGCLERRTFLPYI